MIAFFCVIGSDLSLLSGKESLPDRQAMPSLWLSESSVVCFVYLIASDLRVNRGSQLHVLWVLGQSQLFADMHKLLPNCNQSKLLSTGQERDQVKYSLLKLKGHQSTVLVTFKINQLHFEYYRSEKQELINTLPESLLLTEDDQLLKFSVCRYRRTWLTQDHKILPEAKKGRGE